MNKFVLMENKKMRYRRTEENLILVNLSFPVRILYLKDLLKDYEGIHELKAKNKISEEDFLKQKKVINRQRNKIMALNYEDYRLESERQVNENS